MKICGKALGKSLGAKTRGGPRPQGFLAKGLPEGLHSPLYTLGFSTHCPSLQGGDGTYDDMRRLAGNGVQDPSKVRQVAGWEVLRVDQVESHLGRAAVTQPTPLEERVHWRPEEPYLQCQARSVR